MPRSQFYDLTPDRVAKRLAEIQADEDFARRAYWRAIRLVVFWTLTGLTPMAAGLLSSSPQWGPMIFWIGVLSADLGIAVPLLAMYLEFEK